MRIHSFRTFRLTGVVLIAAALQACGSDGPTEPEQKLPAELGKVLVEADLPALTTAGAALLPVSAPVPSVSPLSPSNCSFNGTSQSFVCARVSAQGLTFDRSFTLFDAGGAPQSQFSPTTTASVQTKTHTAGTITSVGTTITIDASDDRTVSGLLTSHHVLNGTSSSTMSGTIAHAGAAPDPFTMMMSSRIDNLVLPSGANQWPGPGTMTTDMTMTAPGIPTTPIRTVTTFTGTKCVTIAFNSTGLTSTLTLDLSNPGATGCTP